MRNLSLWADRVLDVYGSLIILSLMAISTTTLIVTLTWVILK